jgi:hypothetical protein
LLISISGNFALLPLRTRTRGPAIQLPALPADVTELTIDAAHESYDPLDEILALFRANTFFRNFEIKGPADRVLIYGILFVSEVLSKIKPGMSKREAEKVRNPWGVCAIGEVVGINTSRLSTTSPSTTTLQSQEMPDSRSTRPSRHQQTETPPRSCDSTSCR